MKVRTIVLLLVAGLPALASAESYLCEDDQVTGFLFNTVQKQWQQTKFPPTGKYLVKPNTDQSFKGKWIVSTIGESLPFFWAEYDFASTGALRFEGLFGEFAMNRKSLRFVKTYIGRHWTPGTVSPFGDEERDAPSVAIGKCSLLDQ